MLTVILTTVKIPDVKLSLACRPLEKGRAKGGGWMRRSRGASILFTQFSNLFLYEHI
jgi:hypothetical protein